MNAIRNSWNSKVDAVELDLRMTLDKVVVLFHDEKINGKYISLLSFKEIEEIDSEIPRLSSILNAEVPLGYYIFDLK